VPPEAVQRLNGLQLAPVRTAGGGTNDKMRGVNRDDKIWKQNNLVSICNNKQKQRAVHILLDFIVRDLSCFYIDTFELLIYYFTVFS
jgi:hypothetical protein